jgi:hypothetical protein
MANVAAPGQARKWVGLGVAILLLLVFYRWTTLPALVSPYQPPYQTPGGPGDAYNALATALLAGKTSLLIKPRPELLALDDPYDPVQSHQCDANGPYCLHDISLYKGKYYLYFGVTPVVTLFAPFLLATGQYLATDVAAMLFGLAGVVFTALLLNLLADRFFPALGAGARSLLVLAVGCCNCVPFLLRSPFIYEVAILAAYCFLMGGLYFLARGSLGDRLQHGSAAVGSLLLGLAIGCRPHMALVALVVFAVAAVWFVLRLRRRELTLGDLCRGAAVFAGPWLLCAGLLAAYNYHRFHSFSEFGARYALVGGTVRIVDLPMLDWHRLKADLYCYLLHPPELRTRFPYVRLNMPDPSLASERHFGFTPVAGLLVGMPVLGFLALAPLTLFRSWKSGRYGFLAALTVLLTGGLLVLLCVSCFGCAMRYTVDFAGLLLFSALLVFFDLDLWCRGRALLLWPLRTAAVAGLIVSCLFNLGISIEGQRALDRDLAVRDQLRGVFPRIPLLGNLPLLGSTGAARLQVVFPANKPAGQCEPLIVTGQTGAGDFIYVRYLDDNQVAFVFDHWGYPNREGKAVRVTPGRCYTIEAELRAGDAEIVCLLDGEEVLAVNSDIYPLGPTDFRVGENRIGGGLFTAEVFSGEIQAASVRIPFLSKPGRR